MTLFNILRPVQSVIRTANPFLSRKCQNVKKQLNVAFYSTRKTESKGIMKFTLISASVGALVGIGYSGYTHYQINTSQNRLQKSEDMEPLKLDHLPDFKPTRKIISETDDSNLHLVLFQYQTCPFCCKVRAFLDANGFSYEVVEVDAVLRQSIKWSSYKKVPILLAKTSAGYQQLNDSSAIISVLSTYLLDRSADIDDIIKYYPTISFTDDSGKNKNEILNKYFLMFNEEVSDNSTERLNHERKWRKWSDEVLVHTLSPNVYRTLDEAYQAFNWFAEVGEWRKHFPSWECSLMINAGAYAMWLIGKRLKKRHHLKGDVRQSMYDECNCWMRELKIQGGTFMGGSSPNLSDLAVYGVLSSIEGCDAFKDLTENTNISSWFSNMKQYINKNKGIVHV